jgi:hypothetical protein
MKIHSIIVCAAMLALSGAAWAKLPPADPAKAAEAKAKADEAAKKDAELLTKAQDRVAARYIKEQKAKGKAVKPQMTATAPAAPAKPAKK